MPVVTVVRHGETKLNRANVVQSRTPGELTEKGIKMAEALGQHLQDEKFTHIFTSDLTRCHDTTLNILKHSKQTQPEPQLKQILRERDYGDLEFQSAEIVVNLMKEKNLPNHMVPIPGGESHEDVLKRCENFFKELCQVIDTFEISDNEMNILVVTHGAWIQTFLDYLVANPDLFELHGFDHEKAREIPLLNTGNTKFHVQKLENASLDNNNRPPKRLLKFHHYHCTKHLDNLKFDE